MDPVASLVTAIAALNACGLFAAALSEHRTTRTPRPLCRRRTTHRDEPGRASETLRFLKAWTKAPLRVSAVAPSGRALAALMTREIGASSGPVIELGPGTGVFTRALIARGVRQDDLALIELGEAFAHALGRQHPDVHTICMDAADLHSIELFGGRPAGAVVSGLPLLSIPPVQVAAILKGAFGKLAVDGAFYQFTYGLRCPVPRPILEELGLEAERIGGTFANIPPAAVYRFTRKAARSSRPLHAVAPKLSRNHR